MKSVQNFLQFPVDAIIDSEKEQSCFAYNLLNDLFETNQFVIARLISRSCYLIFFIRQTILPHPLWIQKVNQKMDTNNSTILLELNLLENGIDFILKGIDELFDEKSEFYGDYSPLETPSSCYKYGYLHLFSGFLLLLKERLSRYLPELIFKGNLAEVKEKMADPKKQKSLITVNLDETIKRLKNGPKVAFSDSENGIIRSMQRYRNQFEHFKVSENKYELWAIVSDFLILVDNFLVKELKINIETSTDSKELLRKIESIDTVWKRIKEQKETVWKINIDEKFVIFQETRNQVLGEMKNKEYSSKGDFEPYITCPDCEEETLLISGEYQGICSNECCNGKFPITQCVRCYNPVTGFDWEFKLCTICNNFIEQE